MELTLLRLEQLISAAHIQCVFLQPAIASPGN